ncbi:MAG: hypothetical protein GEU95_14140 [Rhizobiales bacterium]|nr:hypothetical protein [Hyphomicrobiales bacterium]
MKILTDPVNGAERFPAGAFGDALATAQEFTTGRQRAAHDRDHAWCKRPPWPDAASADRYAFGADCDSAVTLSKPRWIKAAGRGVTGGGWRSLAAGPKGPVRVREYVGAIRCRGQFARYVSLFMQTLFLWSYKFMRVDVRRDFTALPIPRQIIDMTRISVCCIRATAIKIP